MPPVYCGGLSPERRAERHQRPSIALTTARAAGPAVEVRSTVSPSRSERRPGRDRARRAPRARSRPPGRPRARCRAAVVASRAVGQPQRRGRARGRGRRDAAPRRRASAVVVRARRPRGSTRDAPAWPPRARWPPTARRPLSAFGAASHRETLRAACHGTISSTPSSVAACTASSSRSPFASACTSTMRGGAAARSVRAVMRTTTSRGETSSHTPVEPHSPAVADRDRFADAHPPHDGRMVRLGTRSVTRTPRPRIRRPRRARSAVPWSAVPEAVAQLREQALLEFGELGRRRLRPLREAPRSARAPSRPAGSASPPARRRGGRRAACRAAA